jgi:hypothetical protein
MPSSARALTISSTARFTPKQKPAFSATMTFFIVEFHRIPEIEFPIHII